MYHVLGGPDAPSGAAPLRGGSAVEAPVAAGPAPHGRHIRSGRKTPPSPESSGEGGADSGPGRQSHLCAATRATPPASGIPVTPPSTAMGEPVFARRGEAFRPAETGVS